MSQLKYSIEEIYLSKCEIHYVVTTGVVSRIENILEM